MRNVPRGNANFDGTIPPHDGLEFKVGIEVVPVDGDATYTAKYKAQNYTITWKNWDGSTL